MSADAARVEQAEAEQLLGGLGISPNVLKQTLNNAKLTSSLVELIKAHGLQNGCSKEKGALVMIVGSTFPVAAIRHRPLVMDYILKDKIITNDQLNGAIKYFKGVKDGDAVIADFEKAAGVGIVVGDADITAAVVTVLQDNREALEAERYRFNTMKLLQPIKNIGDMAWADINKVKAELATQTEAILGPKTAADEKPKEKPKKVKAPKPAKAKEAVAEEDEAWKTADPYAFLPDPKDNTDVHEELTLSDGTVERFCNTPEQLKQHLAVTGGSVVTRFPPEPNGYLHIGHAKAMFVDFGFAAKRGGKCFLRFDDTNPEAESPEYIDHIKEIVRWMGWTYCEITYSSDHFQTLYEFAVRLIREDKAYVCHQTGPEIKATREERGFSPWRDRPVAESLRLFEDMRRGLVDEGTATLRLKMDPKNDNRNMDDLVAYRVKFCPHPHVGATWCIYPSYDFTHCIVDALENISHSLCTLEFTTRRASYYWLLRALGLYMPVVWEYSRLNITQHVMSKRKLQALVGGGDVRGWDDPRLPTLAGMRRRGLVPEGINSLCKEIGITRSEGYVQLKRLYHHVRLQLDATSPRALAVLRPLRLVVDNLPDDHVEQVKALDFPGRGEQGYEVPFSKVCYIEATDFREADAKDFYGLAPGKSIMLRYAYAVHYKSHSTDANGVVTEVHVEYEPALKGKPPKGVVNWVARPAPAKEPTCAEARLYSDALFKSENPGELEDWRGDLNKESEEVLQGVMLCPRLLGAKRLERFQFERLGYFCVDTDSTPEALVFNRTCTLRDQYAEKR
eukprot:jgi/Ulvmu1/561/UM001_0569.1